MAAPGNNFKGDRLFVCVWGGGGADKLNSKRICLINVS